MRPQDLEFQGMFVVLLSLAEFIGDGKLKPPILLAERKATPRSVA